MTKNDSENIDFKALQQELEEINDWFSGVDSANPSLALEKYRRSVEIVKSMKTYLVGIENEFKVISAELDQEE